jgi:hypothetical protein
MESDRLAGLDGSAEHVRPGATVAMAELSRCLLWLISSDQGCRTATVGPEQLAVDPETDGRPVTLPSSCLSPLVIRQGERHSPEAFGRGRAEKDIDFTTAVPRQAPESGRTSGLPPVPHLLR